MNVAKLSHPNIVPMLGTDDSSTMPTIVYYFCDGREVSTFSIPGFETGENGNMAFSIDGKWLACTVENEIIVWNLYSGEFKRISGHNNTVSSLCFHPNNEMLVSGGPDRSIRLWNIHTGESMAEIHHHKERVVSILFSSDGNLMVSSDAGGCKAIWQTTARKFLFELDPLDGEAALAENWIGPKLFSKDRASIRAEIVGAK